MSIQGEIDRINNNVSDALAATAEMGASVPETANSNDLGRLIRSIPQSGGGGTSINVTAEVGQTIVVKAVDENGKPTAWESADYQPRTHWMERVELLPETTVEFAEDGAGYALVDFVLEAGKAYTIKYNGVEYADCVGVEVEEGLVFFGNLYALDQSFPVTEHPFVVMYGAEDIDGDGNIDHLVGVFPLDGSESVTLSIIGDIPHKLDGKFLPQGTPYLEPFDDVVLEEINPMDYFLGAMGDNGGVFNFPINGIIVGNIYEVTFEGVPYLLKAYPVVDQVGEEYFYAALGTGCISNFAGDGYIANETPGLPYSKAPFSLRIVKPSFAQQNGYTAVLHLPDAAEGYEPGTLAIRGAYRVYATDTNCLPDFSTPLFVTITEERTEVGRLTYTPDYLLEEAMCAARNGNLSYLKLSWGDSYRIFHLSDQTQWGLKFLRIYIREDRLHMEHLVWRFDGITVEEVKS